MSEHFFGLGSGWMPTAVAKIAKKHNAVLVNHTDDQCKCGWGCYPRECRSARRHWFACHNTGEPGNSQTANAVMAELKSEGWI